MPFYQRHPRTATHWQAPRRLLASMPKPLAGCWINRRGKGRVYASWGR
jgi:hypothetical protein